MGRHLRKKNTVNIKNQSGFTLLEVLIALAIFSIGILALASLQVGSRMGTSDARKITEASAMAQWQIEQLTVQPFATLNALVQGTTMTETSSEAAIAGPNYTIEYTLLNRNDINGDLIDDMLTIEVVATHNSGDQSATYRFAKFLSSD